MLTLSAKIRQVLGKKVKNLKKKGILPSILYGPKIKKALPLEIDLKEFEQVFQEAGESTLISLKITGAEKENLVLIHDVKRHSLTEKPIHIDFYEPRLEQEIEAKVPIIFEGESIAVKDLGGTFVKNISEVMVRAKPQNLPKEIRVNIAGLKTFEDNILAKDLFLPEGAKILKEPQEIIAQVMPPEKAEEEIAKPAQEKVEEVEKVQEQKPAGVTEGKEKKGAERRSK